MDNILKMCTFNIEDHSWNVMKMSKMSLFLETFGETRFICLNLSVPVKSICTLP